MTSWVLDTGATHHLIPNASDLDNPTLSSSDSILVGNGSSPSIVGPGNSVLHVNNNQTYVARFVIHTYSY